MDVRALERLRMLVKRILNLVDDKVRHLAVDIPRQFDKTRFDTRLFRLPGEIKGIDWNAIPAESGSGIKRHEAKRFGRGSIDHLPYVDAHAVAHQRQFVHQTDIDHAERVLE